MNYFKSVITGYLWPFIPYKSAAKYNLNFGGETKMSYFKTLILLYSFDVLYSNNSNTVCSTFSFAIGKDTNRPNEDTNGVWQNSNSSPDPDQQLCHSESINNTVCMSVYVACFVKRSRRLVKTLFKHFELFDVCVSSEVEDPCCAMLS